MSSAVPHYRQRPRLSRHAAAFVASLGCVIAAVAMVVTLAQTPSGDRPQPPMQARPGSLTGTEQAAVIEALADGDSRQRRIALEVATGQAGASALGDPAILHHHGVDTTLLRPRDRAEVAAERFHHR